MARAITIKKIQVNEQCSCGHNEVNQQKVKIRFKDMAAAGIRHKKDQATGKYFFIQVLKQACDGSGHYG